MDNHVGNNINAIRVHYGLSQAQLAEQVGVSQTTVSSWECGQTFPRRANIERLLSLFPELKIDDIDSTAIGFARRALGANPKRQSALIPLYGSISAGKSVEMLPVSEYLDVSEALQKLYPRAFFLRISGESMNRVLANGSLALVDPQQRQAVDGGIYALSIDRSEATVKRVRIFGETLVLQPDSTDPGFEETVFHPSPDSQVSVSIIGRVVWHCPPLDATP